MVDTFVKLRRERKGVEWARDEWARDDHTCGGHRADREEERVTHGD